MVVAEEPGEQADQERTTQEIHQRFQDLRRRHLEHPGRLAHLAWMNLRRTYTVLDLNYQAFATLTTAPEKSTDLAIELTQNVRDSPTQAQYWTLLDLHLHNFLSSAMTLVDHTRVLLRNYDGTDFGVSYEKHKDALASKPVSKFIKNLRNYLLHFQLPSHFSRIAFGVDFEGHRFTAELPGKELLKWDRWDSAARKYIVDCGDELILSEAMSEYMAAVVDLYKWIFNQFDEIHGAELAAANALILDMNKLYPPFTLDSDGGPPVAHES